MPSLKLPIGTSTPAKATPPQAMRMPCALLQPSPLSENQHQLSNPLPAYFAVPDPGIAESNHAEPQVHANVLDALLCLHRRGRR